MKPPTLPLECTIPDLPKPSDRFLKVYKLLKNLYGLKDAGRTWNQHLRKGLIKRGWLQSPVDECLFIKNGMLLILYVDDACIILPSYTKINEEITSLKSEYYMYSGSKRGGGSSVQRAYLYARLRANLPRVCFLSTCVRRK